MTPSLVIEVLRRAARITIASSSVATGGEWWADREVVHAPHWHPDRQGEACYPLVGQNGCDPVADTEWAALWNPMRGPRLEVIFSQAADQVARTGAVDALVLAVVALARDVTTHKAGQASELI
jgi:hypothetical protein